MGRHSSAPHPAPTTLTHFPSSCVNTIEDVLSTLTPPPHSVDVSIVLQSVKVRHDHKLSKESIKLAIEEAGFDVESSTPNASPVANKRASLSQSVAALFTAKQKKHIAQCSLCQSGEGHATTITKVPVSEMVPEVPETPGKEREAAALCLSVGGMTCAACSNTLTRLLSEVDGVSDVVVDLMGHSARVVVDSQKLTPIVMETIEDAGFDAEMVKVEPLVKEPIQETTTRTISLRVDGMHCE